MNFRKGAMDIDVLCMMAHPDDAEILCGGTIIKLKEQGYHVGIVDFTRGEMGTRGNADQRTQEAACAAEIMGVDVRANLEFPDAHIENTIENRRLVVQAIRGYRPTVIITHDSNNRNPDHTHTSMLVKESSFTAGLAKYDTSQKPYRPSKILFTMEYYSITPTFYVDITRQFEQKMQAVTCYRSQIYNLEYRGLPTYISSDRFAVEIEARMRYFGSQIHTDFAESFRMDTPVEIRDLVREIGLRAIIPGQSGKKDEG